MKLFQMLYKKDQKQVKSAFSGALFLFFVQIEGLAPYLSLCVHSIFVYTIIGTTTTNVSVM